MKRILVTGGTGYIGSHTVVALQEAGYEVLVVDNLSNSKKEVLQGVQAITAVRPAFFQVDCTDYTAMESIFKQYHIDGVIHFAASKAVGESVEQPLLYYQNNLLSLIQILSLMDKYQVEPLVFSSSCTVYGEPDTLPVTENSPIYPASSPYGNTKQINEEIIRDQILSGRKLKATILRYFNPIGAHPSAHIGELPQGTPQNILPYLTQVAAQERPELTIFGDDYDTPDGTCIRDYIHICDLADAHVVALARMLQNSCAPQDKQPEYFNIGTGKGSSVLELVHTFQQATGIAVPYKIGPRRSGDISAIWADTTKAHDVLGWQAKRTLSEALASAWAWQKILKSKQHGS